MCVNVEISIRKQNRRYGIDTTPENADVIVALGGDGFLLEVIKYFCCCVLFCFV
jgi:NAD kinase